MSGNVSCVRGGSGGGGDRSDCNRGNGRGVCMAVVMVEGIASGCENGSGGSGCSGEVGVDCCFSEETVAVAAEGGNTLWGVEGTCPIVLPCPEARTSSSEGSSSRSGRRSSYLGAQPNVTTKQKPN